MAFEWNEKRVARGDEDGSAATSIDSFFVERASDGWIQVKLGNRTAQAGGATTQVLDGTKHVRLHRQQISRFELIFKINSILEDWRAPASPISMHMKRNFFHHLAF